MFSETDIKNLLINFAVFLVTSMLILFSLEIFFDVIHPYKITTRIISDQYHPVMGWANIPNLDGKVRLSNTTNLFYNRKHNSKGLRSLREISYEKSPGVKRILLIGDSFFWGFGVNDEEVVSEVLQKMTGDRIEIINGAVVGYGTDQELLWLKNEGFKYKPDLVICGMFADNDLDDISHSILNKFPKPYYQITNGLLILKNVPVPDIEAMRRQLHSSYFWEIKKFLRHNLHTYQFVAQKLNSIPVVKKILLQTGIIADYTAIYKNLETYELTGAAKKAELAEALIKEMKRECERNGSLFILFNIPVKEQEANFSVGYTDCSGQSTDNCILNQSFFNNSINASYLQQFTTENNIPFIDFLPTLRKNHRNGNLLHYRGKEDFHWNALGHKVAAEEIYRYLWDTP